MSYRLKPTVIPDVTILEPGVFAHSRGFFAELFDVQDFAQATGLNVSFVQGDHSRSAQGVLHDLPDQRQQGQAKLARMAGGAVFDVDVDMPKSSHAFGQSLGSELGEENHHQFWRLLSSAHGFLVLSETTGLLYETMDCCAPAHERGIAWNDRAIGIQWPEGLAPQCSDKDHAELSQARVEVFA